MLCDEGIPRKRASEQSATRCSRKREAMRDYTLTFWWGIKIQLTQWMRYTNISIYSYIKDFREKFHQKYTLKIQLTISTLVDFSADSSIGISFSVFKLHSLLCVVPLVYIPNQFYCIYDLLSLSISCERSISNF